jgi:predicted RNase H-like HicB family nuclease
MTDRRTYRAVATYADKWWAVRVPELPGVFTQARKWDEIPDMVRDAIATLLDVPAGSFDVQVSPEVEGDPGLIASLMEERTRAQEEEKRAHAAVGAASRRLARVLTDAGMAARETAAVLDYSHQRISQLCKE